MKKLSVSMLVKGDEILNGRTTDLNANWLQKFLFKKSLHLDSVYFIRDNEEEFETHLKLLLKKSDIVITSGGIGPTLDDLTKKCLAQFFHKSISANQNVANLVVEQYKRFGREWKPELNFYHHFPNDFLAINNPLGLAPGLGFFQSTEERLVLSGPGVPREFQAMVEEEFIPLMKKFFPNRFTENYQTVIRTHSLPEEKIFTEYEPTLWSKLEKYGKVSSLPHLIGIDIVISYTGSIELHEKNKKEIEEIFITSKLNEFIWQFGNKNLNDLILEKCTTKKIKIGFAESCTGGLVSSKITDLSGSSAIFEGAIVSYANEVKIKQLNVKEETIKNFGAVSTETAIEMASGLRKNLNLDIALAITGIAGPSGGTVDKPVGTVCFGVASKNGVKSFKHQFPGDRIRKKERFSEMALFYLWEEIKEL